MFRDGRPIREEPVLGVVAAGSGCDLVRSFGVPGTRSPPPAPRRGEHLRPRPDEDLRDEPGRRASDAVRAQPGSGGDGAQQVACAAKAPAWLGGSRRFYLLVRLPEDEGRASSSTTRAPGRGEAWNVVVANAQFTDGGLRLSPRPSRGTGCSTPSCSRTPLGRVHAAAAAVPPRRPRPGSAHQGAEGRIRFEMRPSARCRCSRTASHSGRRRRPGSSGRSCSNCERAVPRTDRRAADEASGGDLDALVVALPDLAYLAGYDPMPLRHPAGDRASAEP